MDVIDADVSGMSAERLELARELMRDHVESGRSPSATAVVLCHGDVVFAEAFGVQRPGGPSLGLDHVWPIASAGKPLTAATLLSLVEEGQVGVMTPVVDFFPEL